MSSSGAWNIGTHVSDQALSAGADFMPEIRLVAAVAIAGLAASAGVGAASAADMETVPYSKTPAYVVPAYDWSGGYAPQRWIRLG